MPKVRPHPLTSPWHVIFIISYPAASAPFSPRIVGPCARARDIPSRVAPTRCIFRDRDRSRRGRLGRTPIPVVQHPPPPAGPPNEPEVFQLFLTGKLFSPLTLAVSCNLARAIELNPCKADEGKELTADEKDTCCKGIFTDSNSASLICSTLLTWTTSPNWTLTFGPHLAASASKTS